MFSYNYQCYNTNRFIFDKNRYRVKVCPCGKSNKDGKFVPYVGFDQAGYCHSCQKAYTPQSDIVNTSIIAKPLKRISSSFYLVEPSNIPIEHFNKSIDGYANNNLVEFLISLLGKEKTTEIVKKYFLGTSNKWHGASIYWQIDIEGKIRSGKIMLYDPKNGKRRKDGFSYINWVHTVENLDNYNFRPCLFGEHLLRDKSKPVAIVESEKTAIIASVYLPEYIWLATGGKANLKKEILNVLRGRSVTLFPDSDGYDLWCQKATEFSDITTFNVSVLLQEKATELERLDKYDLADYLIRYHFSEFLTQCKGQSEDEEIKKISKVEAHLPLHLLEGTILKVVTASNTEAEFVKFDYKPVSKSENWDIEIAELEELFASIDLPYDMVKLNPSTTITNIPQFISSHLYLVKNYNGNKRFKPYLERLYFLKSIVLKNN